LFKSLVAQLQVKINSVFTIFPNNAVKSVSDNFFKQFYKTESLMKNNQNFTTLIINSFAARFKFFPWVQLKNPRFTD